MRKARPPGLPVPRRTAGRALRAQNRGRGRPRDEVPALAACIAPAFFLATGVALAVLFLASSNHPSTVTVSGQNVAPDTRLEAPKLRARASEASQRRVTVSAFADGARPAAWHSLQPLLEAVPGDGLAAAGLPRFPRIFARDAFLTALLSNDATLLRAHLDHAAQHQGAAPDPATGEEPGKIPHEWPGVHLNGRSTAYAAVDTTPLFFLALGRLLQLEGCLDGSAVGTGAGNRVEATPRCRTWSRYRVVAERAVAYINAHVDARGHYEEDLSRAGADAFALHVTYWKVRVAGRPPPPLQAVDAAHSRIPGAGLGPARAWRRLPRHLLAGPRSVRCRPPLRLPPIWPRQPCARPLPPHPACAPCLHRARAGPAAGGRRGGGSDPTRVRS